MSPRSSSARFLRPYVAVVALAGLVVFGLSVESWARWISAGDAPMSYWTFAGFLLFSEIIRIELPRKNDEDESNISTTFMFALLIIFGIPAAVATQGLASFVTDLVRGKPLWKASFNAGQLSLSLGAAGLFLQLSATLPTGHPPDLDPMQLPAIVAAGVVFYVLNVSFVDIGLSLSNGWPIVRYTIEDLRLEAWTGAALLLIAPILVAVSSSGLFLTPLIAVPLLGVYLQGRLMARNRKQLLYDPLTQLPNRLMFGVRLTEAIDEVDDGERVCVIVMDLNRFKEINDTLGHHRGDDVLKEVAARFAASRCDGETLAHLGADEFALLLPKVVEVSEAERRAEDLLQSLQHPLAVEGLPLYASAALGLALYPDHAEDPAVLLRYADIAMHNAKSDHLGYALYRPDLNVHSPMQLAMVGELKRAIDEETEFVLHYQPKVDMRSGSVIGVEALLRWEHPKLGLLYPDSFISLAERTGHIRPLTRLVLDKAIAQCAAWRTDGLELEVAVNLSPRNFLDPDFFDELSELLERHGLEPSALTLEITEGTLMLDPDLAMNLLDRLRTAGVRTSIDDFGTGYSSLSYLKHLHVSEVKIDRSFVMSMIRNEKDQMIVRSVVDLARNLSLDVVAEGVIDLATYELLSELGCDVGQGYYVSRAVPSPQLERWLASHEVAARATA